MAYVGIDRCTSYSIDEIQSCINRICSISGMPDVQGRKVLVKPNILSDAKPEDCITTNPEVVRAVIRLLKEKGASEILVGDSPGLHNPGFMGRNCGIHAVCEEEGATWVNFLENPVNKRIYGTKAELPMASVVDQVDLVFSVCKFKTHSLMYATGAVKNLFGTIPNINKALCHAKYPSRYSFAKLIVGIHQTIRPAFCIMDAVIGMEGAGPANGSAKAVNLLLASDNCFAMDIAEAMIMGYDLDDIPILSEARKQHLIPEVIEYPCLDPKDLVIGDFQRVQVTKRTRFVRTLILPFLTRGAQKRRQRKEPAPHFDDQRCIRCSRCVNICPPKALEMKVEQDGTKHVICDYSKCIRCYCCHEMCPVDAIKITKKEKT